MTDDKGWVIEFSEDEGATWQRSDADDGDKVWPDKRSALNRARESLFVNSEHFTNAPSRTYRVQPVGSVD